MNPSLWSLPRGLFQELLIWLVPIGVGFDWWGTSANIPRGYILADGSVYQISKYPRLGKIYGATYGGDGVSTFGVPDVRGRMPAGKDDMGGTAANRITSGGSGITGTTLGATGGAETVALSAANHASHRHTGQRSSSSGTGGLSGTLASLWITFTGAVSAVSNGQIDTDTTGNPLITNQGSGTAHQNMTPTIICNYIIRAG